MVLKSKEPSRSPLKKSIKGSRVISDHKIFETLKEIMEERGWKSGNYVMNDFPQKKSELDAWKDVFGQMMPVKLILNLNCTPKTSSQRIV